jgi:S1-C subfamily serine protease
MQLQSDQLEQSHDYSLLSDPVFREFFGNQVPEQQQQNENSLGSGVIVRADGVVVQEPDFQKTHGRPDHLIMDDFV